MGNVASPFRPTEAPVEQEEGKRDDPSGTETEEDATLLLCDVPDDPERDSYLPTDGSYVSALEGAFQTTVSSIP